MTRAARLAATALWATGLGWAASLTVLAQTVPPTTAQTVNLPAGTKIELVLTRPVWARTAKPGDALYAQTDFPVTSGQSLAIPAGTFVQGTIESIVAPTRRQNRAQIEVLFTDIIFANNYAIALPQVWPPHQAAASGGAQPTASQLSIEASTSNDLLLDNGAQFDMTLATPLAVDASAVAASLPLSHPLAPGSFRSATLCRPTPGTPGSPGTPGTPGTVIPGTPDTVIPGGPGQPDTVIPGTPPTVIPGSPGTPGDPGTPGTSCPSAPIVLSSTPIVNPAPSASGSVAAH